MAVGVSHETAKFAVATIRRWLLEIDIVYYKNCTDLLIQADSGGASACDSWLWKVELQKLADEFHLAITVTHYPTGSPLKADSPCKMDLYFSDSVLDQKEKSMLKQGQVLNNRYQIHAVLGQGGFGAVYKGWDDNVQRHCAIKENLQVTPESQKQFKREAVMFSRSICPHNTSI